MRQEAISEISRLSGKSVNSIRSTMSLRELGFSNSISLRTLRSALEKKLQIKLGILRWNQNLDEILQMISAQHEPSLQTATQPTHTSSLMQPPTHQPLSFLLGVDLEEVAQMPLTMDFRNHAFYTDHFTDNELANALLKSDPRVHLCGLFCAKEALRKLGLDFIRFEFKEIEIDSSSGIPEVAFSDSKITQSYQITLSISHTNNYATATALAQRLT